MFICFAPILSWGGWENHQITPPTQGKAKGSVKIKVGPLWIKFGT